MHNQICVVKIPFSLGSHRRGCELGPAAIAHAGLAKLLQEKGFEAREFEMPVVVEEDESNPALKNESAVAKTAEIVAAQMESVLRQNLFPLVVGGDHSIAVGTVAGVAKACPNLGVIWVDAHGDANTEATTPTGNIHGMPLAASLGFGSAKLTGVGGFSPKILPQNAAIIGARDLDPGEIAFLREHGVACHTNMDVERLGIAEILRQVEEKFAQNGVEAIHLSFDLDALEPHLAKGVGTPVYGGLTYRESAYLLKAVRATGKLVSAEFVEMNPLFDDGNQTAKMAVSLIGELF